MVRWDPTQFIAQGNKTKNQPEEYKLFFSCFAEIIMKKSGNKRCFRNEVSSTSLYTQNQNGLNSEKRVSFSENKESNRTPY